MLEDLGCSTEQGLAVLMYNIANLLFHRGDQTLVLAQQAVNTISVLPGITMVVPVRLIVLQCTLQQVLGRVSAWFRPVIVLHSISELII